MLWYWPSRSLERSDIDHADHSNALILTMQITQTLWCWPCMQITQMRSDIDHACRSLKRSDIDHADHSNALILTVQITQTLWCWPCRSLERSDVDRADHSNTLMLTMQITQTLWYWPCKSLKNLVICSAWGTHESILHPCTAELAVMTSMCMSKIINLHTTIKSF